MHCITIAIRLVPLARGPFNPKNMRVGNAMAEPPPAMTLIKPARDPIPNRRSIFNSSAISIARKIRSQDILPFTSLDAKIFMAIQVRFISIQGDDFINVEF